MSDNNLLLLLLKREDECSVYRPDCIPMTEEQASTGTALPVRTVLKASGFWVQVFWLI